MKTIALIGDPVQQSPSPAMHRAAFRALGLDIDYVAERVTRERLPHAFDALREKHIGLNVTRPLKEAVIPFLDEVRGDAAAISSVNTVTFLPGRAVGDSTDGAGFLAALRRSGAPSPQRVVILGSGGSARAVGGALRASGASVVIAARNAETRTAVAKAVGGTEIPLDVADLTDALKTADLLVNATPLGERSPLPASEALHSGLTVFDLVYAPPATQLLADAVAAGCRPVGGFLMLVEQAALSFEIWTGIRPPIEAMQDAGVRAIHERARN